MNTIQERRRPARTDTAQEGPKENKKRRKDRQRRLKERQRKPQETEDNRQETDTNRYTKPKLGRQIL